MRVGALRPYLATGLTFGQRKSFLTVVGNDVTTQGLPEGTSQGPKQNIDARVTITHPIFSVFLCESHLFPPPRFLQPPKCTVAVVKHALTHSTALMGPSAYLGSPRADSAPVCGGRPRRDCRFEEADPCYSGSNRTDSKTEVHEVSNPTHLAPSQVRIQYRLVISRPTQLLTSYVCSSSSIVNSRSNCKVPPLIRSPRTKNTGLPMPLSAREPLLKCFD